MFLTDYGEIIKTKIIKTKIIKTKIIKTKRSLNQKDD